ncbi:MAG: SAM-dependent methyltransferase [Magnetococcales bacterium]|nr:SAM-dependent methyltransferase [Magnetococcales bacterium]
MVSSSGSSGLRAVLSAMIQEAGGRLRFRDWMEAALYHPQWGYYMAQRPRLGREGDFVTAPEMTSLFGELLALQWIEVWQAMGKPNPFTVVEAGAGSGRLALDVLTTSARFADYYAALRYVIIERSPDFQQRQKLLLEDVAASGRPVFWCEALQELDAGQGIEGVIFSNEFLDAFPVHWVEMGEAGLLELAIAERQDGGWEVVAVEPQAPLEPDYLSGLETPLPIGVRTEVGLDGQHWVAEAAGRLQRGVMVTIDYGYTGPEYYHASRLEGTLTGFWQHAQLNDPLAHPGEMDLTAHVDFSAVARVGERAGVRTMGYTTQGWFLMGLGILERLEQLRAKMAPGEALESLEKTVQRLVMPQAMGDRFKVLAQGRGVDPLKLSGFRLNDQRHRL